MHYLSHIVEGYNTFMQQPILLAATANQAVVSGTDGLSGMIKLISDFGVQLVISGMMMLFMWKYMNNVIKRDNKLFEDLSPKIEQLSEVIKNMDASISAMISSHNAHASQSLHALEKDQDDIRGLLLESHDQLRSISGQLTVLSSNMDVLVHMVNMLNNSQYGTRPPLPNHHYDMGSTIVEDGHGNIDHYNIHPTSDEDKK